MATLSELMQMGKEQISNLLEGLQELNQEKLAQEQSSTVLSIIQTFDLLIQILVERKEDLLRRTSEIYEEAHSTLHTTRKEIQTLIQEIQSVEEDAQRVSSQPLCQAELEIMGIRDKYSALIAAAKSKLEEVTNPICSFDFDQSSLVSAFVELSGGTPSPNDSVNNEQALPIEKNISQEEKKIKQDQTQKNPQPTGHYHEQKHISMLSTRGLSKSLSESIDSSDGLTASYEENERPSTSINTSTPHHNDISPAKNLIFESSNNTSVYSQQIEKSDNNIQHQLGVNQQQEYLQNHCQNQEVTLSKVIITPINQYQNPKSIPKYCKHPSRIYYEPINMDGMPIKTNTDSIKLCNGWEDSLRDINKNVKSPGISIVQTRYPNEAVLNQNYSNNNFTHVITTNSSNSNRSSPKIRHRLSSPLLEKNLIKNPTKAIKIKTSYVSTKFEDSAIGRGETLRRVNSCDNNEMYSSDNGAKPKRSLLMVNKKKNTKSLKINVNENTTDSIGCHSSANNNSKKLVKEQINSDKYIRNDSKYVSEKFRIFSLKSGRNKVSLTESKI